MDKKNTRKQEEPEEELLEGHWPIEHPDDEWLRLEPTAAEKIAGFVPRRYELNQLVKFWYRVILNVYWGGIPLRLWGQHRGERGLFCSGSDSKT